jgi:hypothetical protein
MRSLVFPCVVGLFLGVHGCGGRAERDAMLEAVLDDFSRREEISEFGKGDLLLLSSRTHTWKDEQLRGMGTDPQSACLIPESLYKHLTEVTDTHSVAHLMPHSGDWRVATTAQEDKYNAISDEKIDGRHVKSVVSVSAPGVSSDREEAVVIVSFSWGMHGGLGRYHLHKHGKDWRIKCSQLDFYV